MSTDADVSSAFLEIACCPVCHGSFAVNYEAHELVCANAGCGLAYPVRGGVPILIVDQARAPQAGQAPRRIGESSRAEESGRIGGRPGGPGFGAPRRSH